MPVLLHTAGVAGSKPASPTTFFFLPRTEKGLNNQRNPSDADIAVSGKPRRIVDVPVGSTAINPSQESRSHQD